MYESNTHRLQTKHTSNANTNRNEHREIQTDIQIKQINYKTCQVQIKSKIQKHAHKIPLIYK